MLLNTTICHLADPVGIVPRSPIAIQGSGFSMSAELRSNFLRTQIEKDLAEGRVSELVTRFPPEPNGFLHIGHAKSITVNFGLAAQFGGRCHLRFDDTNPEKESQEFIDSIQEDVRWLGFEWSGEVRYASAYFDQLYEWALYLIEQGLAYVCDLSPTEARDYRGTLTEPGKNSPYRDRTKEENHSLFLRMRDGEFADGERVLRAKIDMASPNINLRDPILYRIRHASHHQTGDRWPIYPTYDYAHGQEDAIEGVTHSICTLEFEDHRPLYDWFITHLPVPHVPRQIEFARLNTSYTITSKRKLKQLVDEGIVAGWDDPRMPTIAGLRRRGYPAPAIRHFCEEVGTSRSDSVVDVAMLESAVRDQLNKTAPRAMCVMSPVKVVLSNLSNRLQLSVPNHPSDASFGQRDLSMGVELFIDRDDFREEANKHYKRLVLGKRVRLRGSVVIEAESCDKDEKGNVVTIYARCVTLEAGVDPEDGIKPKGVIHWVCAAQAVPAVVRRYDRLFRIPEPGRSENIIDEINPESLSIVEAAMIEPALQNSEPEQVFQFEREGYFVADRFDHTKEQPVFNLIIGLRDTWSDTHG
jgi:glutaminyl-tRNA synthetase